MSEGTTNLPYYKNEKTGTLQMWEGTPALDNLVSTLEISCTTVATTILTVTAGFKGYVTTLNMYNTTGAAQTFVLADTTGTRKTITIPALGTETLMGDNPFIVLDAGIVTGIAGTANHIKVSVTYFERKV